jgi:adenylosuccinate lyase
LNYDSISPIDGRYRAEAEPLAPYMTELALAEERVRVELAYLRLLVDLGVAPKTKVPDIPLSMERVKALEAELGHDVKAVEVYIRESLKNAGAAELGPFVHLGLTSEDTNSMASAILLNEALEKVMVPRYSELATRLAELAKSEARTVMLARTHGRPAIPTTFGKEMAVFAYRLAERTAALKSTRQMAKFSGAVGTYASFSLLGRRDWRKTLRDFVASMGVEAAPYSTQVSPGERLSDTLHFVMNINQLMVSLARDLWLYQTLDYVHFARPGKVSSSTMPQKVNPVDIENAEGQADISSSLLQLMAYRLQITRMQRDLSDSVVRRMVGQALAHSLVACSRLVGSLASMAVERGEMRSDLESHPEVFGEAEQISRRLKGDERGYEKVKSQFDKGEFSQTASAGAYLGAAPEMAEECPAAVARLLGSRA